MSPTSLSATGDNSPVGDEEYLLRRFPNEPDQFDFTLLIPRLNAFLPSKRDVDGLSLNREGYGFLTAKELLALATSENMQTNGGVVGILTRLVRQHEMTAIPKPSDTPGHIIIPEINRIDYDKKEADGSQPAKQKIKALADILARLAADQVRIKPKQKNKAQSRESS